MIVKNNKKWNDSHSGMVMVLFVLILPCLMGLLALIVDGGIVMSNHRKLQNLSDSIAISVANRISRGSSSAECMAYVDLLRDKTYPQSLMPSWNGGLVDAINHPPLSGPHAGNSQFVEVHLSAPFPSFFSGLFQSGSQPLLRARAVAGMDSRVSGEGVITLDPCQRPGLEVSGGSQLIVAGAVISNSGGGGWDQFNNWVDLGIQQYGTSVANNGTLKTELALIRGGVDTVDNFQNIEDNGPNPLYANVRSIFPDPYRLLPIPVPSNSPSISNWKFKNNVNFSTGDVVSLNPGVYEDISINGSAVVTFNPGIYILSPKTPNQGLRINGSPTVYGSNVMFYFTGSNYLDKSPGYWDILDGAVDGPLPPVSAAGCDLPSPPDERFNHVDFATLDLNLNSGSVNFTGIQDPESPFHNMLFFQRRRNTNTAQVQANAGTNVFFKGSIYAKWAHFKVAGEGVYQSQFTVGTMTVTGGGRVIIEKYDRDFNMAGFIYLVE